MRIYHNCFIGILFRLCTPTLAAPSPTLPSLQLPSALNDNHTFPGLLSPSALDNSTTSFSLFLEDSGIINATLLALQSSACRANSGTRPLISADHNVLPPDPYIYEVPNSLVIVTTYDYGTAIPEACARLCLSKATRYMQMRVRDYNEPIRQHLEYTALSTQLTLNAWPDMTWDMWRATLKGLEHFVTKYPTVSLDFDVEVRSEKGAQEGMTGLGRFGKFDS